MRPSCLASVAGLVIRPNFPEIYYNKTDPRNYAGYIQKLENFLQSKAPSARSAVPPPQLLINVYPRLCLSEYNETHQQNNKNCIEGQYFVQENSNKTKEVCRFRRDILSLCSGLSDTNFGYNEGKPCVLLKMNRVKALFSPPSLPVVFANLPCLCRLADHRPDAPWEPLHQLHDKGEQARQRRASHVLLALFFFFVLS